MDNIDITANNCEGVDAAEIEAMGENAMEAVQDLVMNVDISNIQYSVERLVGSAEKLGFDMDDLEELGFDIKGQRCGYKMCFDKEKIKSYDSFNRHYEAVARTMLKKS